MRAVEEGGLRVGPTSRPPEAPSALPSSLLLDGACVILNLVMSQQRAPLPPCLPLWGPPEQVFAELQVSLLT